MNHINLEDLKTQKYLEGRRDERLLVEYVIQATNCKCGSKDCVVIAWSQLLLTTLKEYREATQ